MSCSASLLKLIELGRARWGRRQLLYIGQFEILGSLDVLEGEVL